MVYLSTLVSSFCLISAAAGTADLPAFTYASVKECSSGVHDALSMSMQLVGGFSVSDLPVPAIVHGSASAEAATSKQVSHGLSRRSVASSTVKPADMSAVGPARNAVIDAVDVATSCLGVYKRASVADKVEHAHWYEDSSHSHSHSHSHSDDSDSGSPPSKIMDSHTDLGYLIGMTSSAPSSAYKLIIDSAPVSRPGDVIIMAGEEGAKLEGWRALPHSLIKEEGGGDEIRAWYGIMYFVENFQESMQAARSAESAGVSPNGIGASASQCADDEVYCWAQCMDASGLDCDSSAALCYDEGTHTVIPYPDSTKM